jgi:hypothetical protein
MRVKVMGYGLWPDFLQLRIPPHSQISTTDCSECLYGQRTTLPGTHDTRSLLGSLLMRDDFGQITIQGFMQRGALGFKPTRLEPPGINVSFHLTCPGHGPDLGLKRLHWRELTCGAPAPAIDGHRVG